MASGQELAGVSGGTGKHSGAVGGAAGDDASDYLPLRRATTSVRASGEGRQSEAMTQSCLQLIQACRREQHLRSLCGDSMPKCVRYLRGVGLTRM
mmetsp:Transcript_87147/g.259981  ORF Transcript_87147/g.259981 Transcript_87147/m.259981 type:complete len:95 (+) Transcript_87147:98-382(+)